MPSYKDKLKPIATTTPNQPAYASKLKPVQASTPVAAQASPEEKKNNIFQSVFTNLVGRPAIRAGQAIVGAGVKAFGSDEQKASFDRESQKPTALPLGLGTVDGQKRFGEKGAVKQLITDAGKSALDIATFGAGAGANTAIRTGVQKVVAPVAARIPGRVLPWVASKVPGVAANVIEGVGYNAASNLLNDRSVGENAGVAAGASAILPPVIGGAIKGAGYVAEKAKGLVDPARIMQRVARISKAKQQKFQQTAGESVGEYLSNRGIGGSVDEITAQLYDRFSRSKNNADEAFASLPGLHKSEVLDTALKELVERETKVSAPGAISPDFNRASELYKKHSTEGLTMSETNEAKRLFERNVKMDYLRDNVSDKIARANNIDNNIRKWQFETADTLGLKNIGEINKETRLARQLMDDIGKEYSGTGANNAVSLTDWIMLSGGDPTAISGFLVKKALSNKRVQSAVARKFANPTKAALPRAEMVPQLSLPAPKAGSPKVQLTGQDVIPVLPGGRDIESTSRIPTAGKKENLPMSPDYSDQASAATTITNNKNANTGIDSSVSPKGPNRQSGKIALPTKMEIQDNVRKITPGKLVLATAGLASGNRILSDQMDRTEKKAYDKNVLPQFKEEPKSADVAEPTGKPTTKLQSFVPEKYYSSISEAVNGTKVRPEQLAALIQSENGAWDEEFVNPAGTDTGLGQHNAATYEDINRIYRAKYGKDYDRKNGEENIRATALWLDHLMTRPGINSLDDAIKAYRIGVEGLRAVRAGKGTKRFTQAQLRSMANDKLASFQQFLEV